MPSLTFNAPGAATIQTLPLYKRVTSVGAGPDCDLRIENGGLTDLHAQLDFDGSRFELVLLDRRAGMTVNGRKARKQVLSDGDVFALGEVELRFNIIDPAPPPADGAPQLRREREIEAYRKLHQFSALMKERRPIPELLEELTDLLIEVTRADKGFLLLVQEQPADAEVSADDAPTFTVQVARNVERQAIADARGRISDSIVTKVIAGRQPVIVSDALRDEDFKAAESVVNLRLLSVMCVPIMARGTLYGILYLGNDRVTNLFDARDLDVAVIFAAQASLLVENALHLDELQDATRSLEARLDEIRFGQIIGGCEAMESVFGTIRKVAPVDIPVLILGETGTGKELIAKELHARSGRSDGPFVAINCGAIAEGLLESELFGHAKGAFTGAMTARTGKIQAADGGTLFLDEVGEMPLSTQVKLLRVLQEHVITRVGENREEPVDIRVVAATNKDLQAEVQSGDFREDLFYRLNVVTVNLPALKDRGEDVVLIARYLLKLYAREYDRRVKDFATDALVALRKYGWPGNIRELENRIRKAVVMADGARLKAPDLDLSGDALPKIVSLAQAKEEFAREYVDEVLALNGGNRTKTARDLDVDPRTIFRHVERYHGDVPKSDDGVPSSDGV